MKIKKLTERFIRVVVEYLLKDHSP